MGWRERIEERPEVLAGKPVIKGTRISVDLILELLANGWEHKAILANYPTLGEEDIRAALEFAREAAQHEQVFRRD